MATTKKATKTDAKRVDYNALDTKELAKKLKDLRGEVSTLKRNTLMGDVQNVHAHNAKRRELARALTALNNKPALGKEE